MKIKKSEKFILEDWLVVYGLVVLGLEVIKEASREAGYLEEEIKKTGDRIRGTLLKIADFIELK